MRALLSALGLSLLVLSAACAGTGDHPDMGPGGPRGDGGAADMASTACFMGTPRVEAEFLNACTPAERIDRPSRVPRALWDGKGPLPPLP